MKKVTLSLLLIIVMLTPGCANIMYPTAKLTLQVVNQDDRPVVNERMQISFYPVNMKKGHIGLTNKEGFFSAQSPCVHHARISNFSSSEKYYFTDMTRMYIDQDVNVKDGKWQPWNPIVKVVLKEYKKPIPMYATSYDNTKMINKLSTWIGFDMLKNDWVSPYGKGDVVDFEVRYDWDGKWGKEHTGSKLYIRFASPFSGAYQFQKDMWSGLISPYRADENMMFIQDLYFFNEKTKDGWGGHTLNDQDGLILRTRTRIDDQGKLIGAHYSKIYGYSPFFRHRSKNRGEIRLQYYFNPTENDTNLECNRTTLFDKDDSVQP